MWWSEELSFLRRGKQDSPRHNVGSQSTTQVSLPAFGLSSWEVDTLTHKKSRILKHMLSFSVRISLIFSQSNVDYNAQFPPPPSKYWMILCLQSMSMWPL